MVKNGFLHCHTMYSLFDSAITPNDLVKRAKELGAKNITLTDHGTLLGIEPFMDAGKEYGINTIPGVELYLANREHFILFAKNYTGYQAISKTMRNANYETSKRNKKGEEGSQKSYACVPDDVLSQLKGNKDIIATTACMQGPIAKILLYNFRILRKIKKLKISKEKIEKAYLNYKKATEDIEIFLEKKKELKKEETNHKKNTSSQQLKTIQKLKKEIESGQVSLFYEQQIRTYTDKKNFYDYCLKRLKDIKKETDAINVKIKALRKIKKDLKTKHDRYVELASRIKEMEQHLIKEEELYQKAKELTMHYAEIFPCFYVELQYHGIEEEAYIMPQLASIAKELGIPVIAGNDAHMVDSTEDSLLARQTMQDAIANRINRQTPAKSMSVLQKEDGVKENDIQKEETPHVNINNFLKKYDIQGRKFGDSVFLQNGNDNSTITPADCMNPAKLQQAIGTVYGNNLDTSIKAALISAACSLTGEEEKDIHHKIPTKRGTIDIEIKQLEKHFASISINGKNVIEKIPKDILKNPKAFRIVDGKGSLTDHIEQKIEEELSKTHTLSKDLTVSIGKDHTLSVWDKEKEIYKGPAEIKAFENIFTEHPLEEISAKTAAVALYCTLKPEEFAKEYQQKSIFDDFSYPDGTAYISVKQDGISLHEPKLSIIDRDMGKLIQKSSQSCTVKEIMAELGLSKDEAKEVKNLQGDETVVVMSEGVPTFATATDEGEIYLYQPEQMPEILTKRAIEPYLEDHKDLLPVLVEKEGKIQTAYIEENGEISYLPAFSDLGYHMEASDTISLLTPDCITPEYFYEFTQELSSLYQLADEKGQDMPVKVSFAKEPESFTYVKEGSGKQPEKVDPNNLPFPEITKDAQEEKKEEKKENASILEEGIVQVEDRDEEEYDDALPFSDMPEQTYSDIPPFSDIDDIER